MTVASRRELTGKSCKSRFLSLSFSFSFSFAEFRIYDTQLTRFFCRSAFSRFHRVFNRTLTRFAANQRRIAATLRQSSAPDCLTRIPERAPPETGSVGSKVTRHTYDELGKPASTRPASWTVSEVACAVSVNPDSIPDWEFNTTSACQGAVETRVPADSGQALCMRRGSTRSKSRGN